MCGDYTKPNSFICKDAADCQTTKGYGLGDFKLALREEEFIPENELWAGILAYDPQNGWGTICHDNDALKPGL